MQDNFLEKINDYYSTKIRLHGPVSEGVDWNGDSSHQLRFDQLSKVIQDDKSFSLLDYGCGYGALYDYLRKNYTQVDYHGYDISEDMLESAKQVFPHLESKFISSLDVKSSFDYVVSNGLFNVKLHTEESVWKNFISNSLSQFNDLSSKGFAFNILTSYSDIDKQKNNLHYADPLYWFDFCKRNFSKNVALLHDYDLYEFTIIVRKA